MSDISSPAVAARPAKRQRADADLRSQRKREADRKAQRNSRERQRSHTDHLENMIAILRKENGNAATSELMEMVWQLRSENERLRKIINSAKSALSVMSPNPQHVDMSGGPPRPTAGNGTQIPVVEGASIKNAETSQPSLLPAKRAIEDVRPNSLNSLVPNGENARKRRQTVAEITAGNNSTESVLNFTESWMDKKAVDKTDNNPVDLSPWSWLSPISAMMPPPARPPTRGMQCQIWEKSNKIYSQISTVTPASASAALRLSPSDYANLIFKAVINGWASLDTWERSNPIMKALQDIDQVFQQLDQVSRAAFMYKSHMLLKYHIDPEKGNWEEMPEWQRPSFSQRTKQHPIAVDFFVWPALRDRLIDSNHSYFTTGDFSAYFRRHYKFSWPYSFEDTYVFNRETNTYQMSPMFARYHRNIKYWGVERPFLEKFPELAGDITLIDSEMDAFHQQQQPLQTMGYVESPPEDATTPDILFSAGFTDGEIAELFDNFPQVG
ncbi:hypothetical protein V495_02409 [Pseudogymnoascus sp. VKM F-4514 (FW-929)]|nr:hypothetical protein V495_02409 [Pseudogymnoascus sp. VKM F-4514 (FW-929)]KFY60265.1 hypothetical protein V497_03755 [Pseudogymnoascus sp. VKM F-4516 (FW-969)]